MGFLRAALMWFNLLPWPLFSLGFPLYASVRAIETNSMQEMRALVAYWILFSLISIFELALGKLIQWLPFWPYIKLITICWLVLPRFYGACYVYDHLIHRCLSVNPEELVNLIIRPKKNTSLDAERFLSMAEKYVKENGCEALEKLIAGKPEHRNPDVDMEEIKAVTNTEEKGTAAAMRTPPKVPNVAKENAKAGELKEKDVAATERSHLKEPDVAKENAKAGEVKKKDLAAIGRDRPKELDLAKENAKAGEEKDKDPVATERVKYVEPNLAQTEKKTVASGEIKEKTAPAEMQVMEELASLEKVQREWACALCQVITTCEQQLSSHLQGRKHKAKCEELKASENKRGSSSISGWEHEKANSGDNPSPSKPKRRRTRRKSAAAKQNIHGPGHSHNSQINLDSWDALVPLNGWERDRVPLDGWNAAVPLDGWERDRVLLDGWDVTVPLNGWERDMVPLTRWDVAVPLDGWNAVVPLDGWERDRVPLDGWDTVVPFDGWGRDRVSLDGWYTAISLDGWEGDMFF